MRGHLWHAQKVFDGSPASAGSLFSPGSPDAQEFLLTLASNTLNGCECNFIQNERWKYLWVRLKSPIFLAPTRHVTRPRRLSFQISSRPSMCPRNLSMTSQYRIYTVHTPGAVHTTRERHQDAQTVFQHQYHGSALQVYMTSSFSTISTMVEHPPPLEGPPVLHLSHNSHYTSPCIRDGW
jgi:hypothetical protein